MTEFTTREFRAMSNIFKEGARGDTAYILQEGEVTIYSMVNGERFVLAKLTAPTIFGEMALLTKDKIRTASAEANSAVKVIEIDQAKFDEVLSKSSPIFTTILQAMVKRLIETSLRLKRLT